MSLLNSFYKHVVVPATQRQRYAGLARNMSDAQQWERLSATELHDRQWAIVSKLLQHAYDTTEFYKRRFDDAGVSPQQIRTPEDLKRIPVLTRSDIRNNRDALRSTGFDRSKLVTAQTGGTTDSPIPFEADPASVRRKLAVQARFNEWAGLRPGDKLFYLWGARVDYVANPSWRWKIYDRYILRRLWAPPFVMNDEVFERHRNMLNDFRPRAIFGYPSAIAMFSDFLKRSGKDFYRPTSLICTAEALLPHQRDVIEAVFQRKIFEHYGSREFGMIGAECEAHSGLHLHPANAFVELLPFEGDASIREMVITDLFNFAMPLIRYQVNDCAEPASESCECGRHFLKVRRIVGRTSDLLRFRGGVVPSVTLARGIAKACPNVQKWQIVQHTVDLCELKYVPSEAGPILDEQQMLRNLANVFADKIEWRLTRVADIPRERSGKTRMCISLVSPQASTQQPVATNP